MQSRFPALIVASVLGFACSASAQVVVQGTNDGAELWTDLSTSMRGSTISYAIPAASRNKQTLAFSVSAPDGAVVSVRVMGVANAAMGAAAQIAIPGAAGTIFVEGQRGGLASLRVVGNAPEQPTLSDTPDPYCGCMTEEELGSVLTTLAAQGETVTREQYCAPLRANGPLQCPERNDTPANEAPVSQEPAGNGAVAGSVYLRHDRCVKGLLPAAVVDVNLAGVSDSALQGGKVGIKSLIDRRYLNNKASVKPIGDGRFKTPLFLSGLVASATWGRPAESIVARRYVGGQMVREVAGRVEDYVFYGGGGGDLVRTVFTNPARQLNGKVTVDVTVGGNGYGVCANMTERNGKLKDQFFNGYRTFTKRPR